MSLSEPSQLPALKAETSAGHNTIEFRFSFLYLFYL